MTNIELYCKANRRKRNDEYVSACGYIIKAGEHYEEKAYTTDREGGVVKLEIAAVMDALLALDNQGLLNEEHTIDFYINNKYIVEALVEHLQKKQIGQSILDDKELKYANLWETIDKLLAKCKGYTAMGLDKKSRGECSEEITKNMGRINRIVCDQTSRDR